MMLVAFSHSRWVVRLSVVLGCFLSTSTVQAMSWTRMGQTSDVTLYLSRPSIEKDDTIRRVWEMQDLKTPDADGVLSRRYINEYDCVNKMHRISQVSSFSGAKLTGKQLFNVDQVGYWRKIPPNGVFVLTYIALCVE